MAEAPQWARVGGDVNIRLRRGAWYKVVSLTPEQAVVDVNEQQLSVARSFLQIVPLRPQRWSVVARPADAVNLPLSWGATYAVCTVRYTRWVRRVQTPSHVEIDVVK